MKKRSQRGHETFQWDYLTYDITAVLRDIEHRTLGERHESTFDRREIALYRAFLEGVPHPDVPTALQERHRVSVDVGYASSLLEADLARPILLLPVGKGEGPLALPDLTEEYDFVVADGNHRLIRAYQLGKDELPVLAVLEPFARRYLVP